MATKNMSKPWEKGTRKKKQPRELREKEEVKALIEKVDQYDASEKATSFKELPLSRGTLKGLLDAGYKVPTEIQSEAIGLALKGFDILGAAKTGSGKTLAFLVPLIEKLYRERWTSFDGLGALIITPTRELAYQIFEVINKIGLHHDFSVGLIIGGADLKFERQRMDKCNIAICTPGRILQHMSENALFNCDNLRILILDEADRILDLGFAKTMDAIIENLPKERQTLLFSATQTKSVKDLARLSLVNPKYVSVHEHAKSVTPEGLVQSYLICELSQKLNLLWSFIKSHRSQKILVFVSTCKQAKYIYDLFCRLKPGTSLMALYGTLHQLRRMAVYNEFCSKQKAVLIATDIASRGLDFPAIDWVVQLDCPEDTNQYIHRAGRTARFNTNGEALLVLLPSEEKSMIEQLKARKVPIDKIDVNPNKMASIHRKVEALCARDVNLKEIAQRAFKGYLKDVFLRKDKTVFDISALDKDAYARSLGLVVTPRVRFLEKTSSKKTVKQDDDDSTKEKKPVTKQITLTGNASDESDGEELFISKKIPTLSDVEIPTGSTGRSQKDKIITPASVARKLLRKNFKVNHKVVFDENGQPVEEEFPTSQRSERIKMLDEKYSSGIDINLAKEIMAEEDIIDKELQRKLIKEKHREQRLKLKEERKQKTLETKMKRRGGQPEPEEEEEEEGEEADASDEETESEDSERGGKISEYIDALPDPDLYYGSNSQGSVSEEGESDEIGDDDDDNEEDDNSSESGEEHGEMDSEDESEPGNVPQKRRKFEDARKSKDLPMSLGDTEALALQLISDD